MSPLPTATTKKNRLKDEHHALVEQYLPLVHHIVGRLNISLPPGLDRDDLFSVGVLGLMKAAATYKKSRGASFKTYAYTLIRGAILDEVRRADPVPRSVREKSKNLEINRKELSGELGRSPTREELAEKLDCPPTEIDRLFVALHTSRVLSIEFETKEEEGGFDILPPAQELSPEEKAMREENLLSISKELPNLPEKACQAIVLYYHEGLLLKDIGTLIGVSESRVSQLISHALTQLRFALNSEGK